MNIIQITEEGIKFNKKNIRYKLVDYHNIDCCEEVYADWLSIPKTVLNKNGENISIFKLDFYENIDDLLEEVEDQGFMLCAKDGTKILVNCYDIQNGYYNSDLTVTLYEFKEIGSKDIDDKNKIHQYK